MANIKFENMIAMILFFLSGVCFIIEDVQAKIIMIVLFSFFGLLCLYNGDD